MNFLDFVQCKSNLEKSLVILNEAFKTSDVDKVHNLMLALFTKKMVDYTRTKFVNNMRTDEVETAKVAYLTFVEA